MNSRTQVDQSIIKSGHRSVAGSSLGDQTDPGGNFLGIDWSPWKVVGWVGNLVFFSRFLVQWWATEKRKQAVKVPSRRRLN